MIIRALTDHGPDKTLREWVRPNRHDPHFVLRTAWIPGNTQVLIKYADKTTEWIPMEQYLSETQVVASNSDL